MYANSENQSALTTLARRVSGALTRSALLRAGRHLWERNQADFMLPLSKSQKLMTGLYLILHDYAQGAFPPTFDDQQKVYDAEIAYSHSLPGVESQAFFDGAMRKPFWSWRFVNHYLTSFLELTRAFNDLGIRPPQRLLELGCGIGWMAEFLALMSFEVVGTSLAPDEIRHAKTRIASIEAKGVKAQLDFVQAPMETVNEAVGDRLPFDVVYVFEALHHAYDWRQAIDASYACLRPGGWFLICHEPNLVHTLTSYRVAKLSNTHEIGFSRTELVAHLRHAGFRRVVILKNRASFFIRPHWIAAQK
jgi:2-polyprenyl-3-methyl-5-hydroxy-6-metoxy-1,4-benzoquinol methylase